MQTHEQLTKKLSTARSNLLAMIVFTCVNIALIAMQSDWHFPFSAFIPTLMPYADSYFCYQVYDYVFGTAGIIAAFIVVAIYAVFWALSKKRAGFIVAALVFFSIDTLILFALVAFVALGGFDIFLLVELAFAAWIMYYLISGTRAWVQLRKLPPEEETTGADDGLIDPAEPASKTIPIAQIPPSTPLRQASTRGRELISTNYNNMKIVVKRTLGATELIVDDMVYAEKTGLNEGQTYILEVNVNGAVINATTEIMTLKEAFKTGYNEDPTPPVMLYLYVNGNLVGSKERRR